MIKTQLNALKAPFIFLDKKKVDHNLRDLKKRSGNLKIRLASKSIRCVEVIKYLLNHSENLFQGVMCFHPDEALMLKEQGIDDLLIAYPYIRESSLENLIKNLSDSDKVYFMADCKEHLSALDQLGKKYGKNLKVSLDIDLSIKFPLVYFGVYRSSVNSLAKAKNFVDLFKEFSNLELKAVMGYEAQFAGVGDNNPFQKLLNFPIKILQKFTWKKVVQRRVAIVDYIKSQGIELDLVNGGGTGSLHKTKDDPSVTELAAGSGIYAPGLFDYYTSFHLEPAMGFALEVTRNPKDQVFTLAGGGYIASGALSGDKHPKPYQTHEMEMIKEEGFGEVQTPFRTNQKVNLGELKFFRHAKAGELCERFNSLYFISDEEIKEFKTYRGEGHCFL